MQFSDCCQYFSKSSEELTKHLEYFVSHYNIEYFHKHLDLKSTLYKDCSKKFY